MMMTPDQAADLAARTLAAIDQKWAVWLDGASPWLAADRKRVASDLAGLRDCYALADDGDTEVLRREDRDHARRYLDNLRRTAALYGVTPYTCWACGRRPATGYAEVDGRWFCHGDDDESPTCFELQPPPTPLTKRGPRP